jgi:GrpB-like predicted nucleotidyltransferase (UPF0157 family)
MSQVILSPFSNEWPVLFGVLREELLTAFAPTTVAIEHIGSTAVPGLAAKPVIDLLLGASSVAEIEAKTDAVVTLGYVYRHEYERELPMRRYFVKAPIHSLRVHLHGVVIGSRLWRQHLAFRDALRAGEALRREYQTLKQRLAAEFANDKAAYTDAKAPFIQSVLARADAGHSSD